MKTFIIPAAILATIALFSFAGRQEKNVDVAKEEEAIKNVIFSETKAFWDKDLKLFEEQWAHQNYVRIIGWWERGGVTVVEGWPTIYNQMKALMEKNPEPNVQNVTRKNLNIRISRDMAWVTFDQYGNDTGEPDMDMPGLSRETRILEKQNGKWKIVYVGWLLDGGEK